MLDKTPLLSQEKSKSSGFPTWLLFALVLSCGLVKFFQVAEKKLDTHAEAATGVTSVVPDTPFTESQVKMQVVPDQSDWIETDEIPVGNIFRGQSSYCHQSTGWVPHCKKKAEKIGKKLFYNSMGICKGFPCKVERDWEACCIEASDCYFYHVESPVPCPADKPYSNYGAKCKDKKCSEADMQTCCISKSERFEICGDWKPGNKLAKFCTKKEQKWKLKWKTKLFPNPEGQCAGKKCNEDDDKHICCKEAADCGKWESHTEKPCPKDLVMDPSKSCEGVKCKEEDQDTCCVEPDDLKSFRAPCHTLPKWRDVCKSRQKDSGGELHYNYLAECEGNLCSYKKDWRRCCERRANCAYYEAHTGVKCPAERTLENLGRTCLTNKCTKKDDEKTCCVKQGLLYRSTMDVKVYEKPEKAYFEKENEEDTYKVIKDTPVLAVVKTGEFVLKADEENAFQKHQEFTSGIFSKTRLWMHVTEPEEGWVVMVNSKNGMKKFRMVYPTQILECGTTFQELRKKLDLKPGSTIQARCPKNCGHTQYVASKEQFSYKWDKDNEGKLKKFAEVHLKEGDLITTRPFFTTAPSPGRLNEMKGTVDYLKEMVTYHRFTEKPDEIGRQDIDFHDPEQRLFSDADRDYRPPMLLIARGDVAYARLFEPETVVFGCGIYRDNVGTKEKKYYFHEESPICPGARILGPSNWGAFDLTMSDDVIRRYKKCPNGIERDGGVWTDTYDYDYELKETDPAWKIGLWKKVKSKEPSHGWRVAPIGKEIVSKLKTGFSGKWQQLKRSYAKASKTEVLLITAKIILKTAANVALAVYTTALMGAAASGVGLPLAMLGTLGIAVIAVGRCYAAAAIGAAIDTTLDWVAIKLSKKPLTMSQKSMADYGKFRKMLGVNILESWKSKMSITGGFHLSGMARVFAWEALGHVIGFSGTFVGPFTFDSSLIPGKSGYTWNNGKDTDGFAGTPHENNYQAEADTPDYAFDFGPDLWVEAEVTDPEYNGINKYYGSSFDYSASLLIELMEAFYSWYAAKTELGQDHVEAFWELAGLKEDIREQVLKEGNDDWSACDFKKGCFAQYLSVDKHSRMVIAGNLAPLMFKNLKFNNWRTKIVENTIDEILTPEEIAEKGLQGKEKWIAQRYTYMTREEYKLSYAQNVKLMDEKVMWDQEETSVEYLKPQQVADKRIDPKIFGPSYKPPPPPGPPPKELLENLSKARKEWKKGSVLQIFSNSGQAWVKGEIEKVFVDDEGEWLQVYYTRPDGTNCRKQIPRFHKNVQPLPMHFDSQEDFGPSEIQPQQEKAPPQQGPSLQQSDQPNTNSEPTSISTNVKSLTARKDWKKGSVLEIFSTSQQAWVKGEVKAVIKDSDGDWLEVSYINSNPSKPDDELRRRYSEQIRPLEDGGDQRAARSIF